LRPAGRPFVAAKVASFVGLQAGSAMSVHGPTRTMGHVRFFAAVRGIADIKRALIRSALIYEYTP
jgi:hypothetical protein